MKKLSALVFTASLVACSGYAYKQQWSAENHSASAAENRVELEVAEEKYKSALSLAREHLSKAEVSSSLYNLGKVYRKQKRFELAAALLRESLETEKRLPSPRQGAIGRRLTELATILHLGGIGEEAMPVFDELMPYAGAYSGPEKSFAHALYKEYGQALQAQGMSKEAEKYIEFAADIAN